MDVGHKKGIADSEALLGRLRATQRREEDAREHFRRALQFAEEVGSPSLIVRARCYLASLSGEDPEPAERALEELAESLGPLDRMEAHHRLFRAAGHPAHLEEAHALLRSLRDHAPEEYRETMIENVPLHRDIMRAWREHSGEAV
jgi:hypothetical protein